VDRIGDRRLRAVELPGRSREAAFLRDGYEDHELVKRKRVHREVLESAEPKAPIVRSTRRASCGCSAFVFCSCALVFLRSARGMRTTGRRNARLFFMQTIGFTGSREAI
jgi:hypothetical protein